MTSTLLAKDKHSHAIQVLKPIKTQVIAAVSTGSVALTSALAPDCNVIRIVGTVDFCVSIGDSSATPVANTSSMLIPAGVVEYLRVDEGAWGVSVSAYSVAVRGLTANGSIYVTEMG